MPASGAHDHFQQHVNNACATSQSRVEPAGSPGAYLCAFDDDRVRRQIDAPGKRCCAAQDFDESFREETLRKVAVAAQHASMMDAESRLEELLQLPVP
jgi:hypothetical protein